MVDGWARKTQTNENNFGTVGAASMIGVGPTQTLLRFWWNFSTFSTWSDSPAYPPGSSILRVGIAFIDADTPINLWPSPVSQPEADWLALTSLSPRAVQLIVGTTVQWHLQWGLDTDMSGKSQRKNNTSADKMFIMAWEFQLGSDAIPGFFMDGWSSSMDALIRTPDA